MPQRKSFQLACCIIVAEDTLHVTTEAPSTRVHGAISSINQIIASASLPPHWLCTRLERHNTGLWPCGSPGTQMSACDPPRDAVACTGLCAVRGLLERAVRKVPHGGVLWPYNTYKYKYKYKYKSKYKYKYKDKDKYKYKN